MSTEPIKVSFNAIPAAMDALNKVADQLGDTRTDTINRALQVYQALLVMEPGMTISFDDRTYGRLDGI